MSSGAALPLTLIVNTLGDAADANVGDGICDTDTGTAGDQCTLRAAIQETNNATTDDTINFSLPPSSAITLDSVLPDIAGNFSVNGPGANLLTVQRNAAGGTPDFRLFMINSGTTVGISGITIANGNLTAANNGGGIRNDGVLKVNRSTISNNNCQGNGGGIAGGGGIYNIGTAFATDSTISTNSAPNGGGILNLNPMTLVNVTISGNTATSQGGGIYNLGTTINFGNSIVAGNTAPSGPDGNGFNFNSLDYNLIGNTSGANFTGTTTHNITNVNPLLGPLLDNGGPTKTHAPLSGSPALEAGNNSLITNPPFIGPPFTDQRGSGFNRIADGDGNATATVDIGAYEQQGTLTIDSVNLPAGRTSGGQQIVLTGSFAGL